MNIVTRNKELGTIKVNVDALHANYLRNKKNIWWDIGLGLLPTLANMATMIDQGMAGNTGWALVFLVCMLISLVVPIRSLIEHVLTYQHLALVLLTDRSDRTRSE